VSLFSRGKKSVLFSYKSISPTIFLLLHCTNNLTLGLYIIVTLFSMSLSIIETAHCIVPVAHDVIIDIPEEEGGHNTIMSPNPSPPPTVETILASIPRGCNNNNNNNHDDSDTLPVVQRLHMPAEWSPHDACLILFPHNRQSFRLDKVQGEVLNLAKTIAVEGKEDVYLLCHDETLALWVQEQVATAQMTTMTVKDSTSSSATTTTRHHHTIRAVVCPSDDTWIRDTGPTFVWEQIPSMNGTATSDPPSTTTTTICQSNNNNSIINSDDGSIIMKNDITTTKRLVGLDWDFNAYGGPVEGCYWPCEKDREVAKLVCQRIFQCPSYYIPICLEGGSFHTDGEGTILTTKECLLNTNRNPHLSQDDIERVLCLSLGATNVIWLPTGLDADNDTNGHVDNFACFGAPGHVVLAWTDNREEDEENYDRCREAEHVLLASTDARGRPIQVTKLYLPSPPLRYTHEEASSLAYADDDKKDGDDNDNVGGERRGKGSDNYITSRHTDEKMAASYVNFYIANGAVVVPQFGVTGTDQMALDTLQGVFPDRTVIGVPTREILLGGGNIHCQTQQVPAHK
jgi:agmatine deiminase